MTRPLNLSRWILYLQTWATDVREGFVEITRHSLAVVGLCVVLASLTLLTRPQVQTSARDVLLNWLEVRLAEPSERSDTSLALSRSTIKSLNNMTDEQRLVTYWLSRKYRVSSEPVGAIVSEAWVLGERSQLPPSLILAIVAIESRFNPFAAGVGASVGLMQIERQAHQDELSRFGGPLSAFDPLTNLRVGVRHLQTLIQQTNSLDEALALYASSSGQVSERTYVDRVLAEQTLLENLLAKDKDSTLGPNGPKASR